MKKQYILWAFMVLGLLTGCEKELKEYEEPTGKISGRVISKNTGKELKDVFVVFEKVENGTLHGVMSKADGSFAFNALSTGEYKIFGVQDTLQMEGDTLRMYVNDGQSVRLADDLVMKNAGVPQPQLPQVIKVTHNAITLRVAYESNGSVVSGYGFFYTSDGSEPTVKSTRKAASINTNIIRKDYYEVEITGLLVNKTYRFKSYLGVKNWTPFVYNNMFVVLSDEVLSITTTPISNK